MKHLVFRILFLTLFSAVVVGGAFVFYAWKDSRGTKVVFLDVGQGDAILISQGRNQILIDGGRSGKTLLSGISRHLPFWDRTIETVIATHPDSDHIGGFPDLFSRYRVGSFFANDPADANEPWELLVRSGRESAAFIGRTNPSRGLEIRFPEGGVLHVLYPESGVAFPSTNEGSVVSRFSFGETDILLTGDLPREELYLPDVPESEVLKLAHHGSKHSSSERFLSRVRPKEAVVSVGKNNYGHPAPEVLSRVLESGAVVRRTDTDGDIMYRCREDANECLFVP